MESVTRQTAIVGDPTGDTGRRGVGGTGEGQQSTGSMCIVAEVNHIQFCYYSNGEVSFVTCYRTITCMFNINQTANEFKAIRWIRVVS